MSAKSFKTKTKPAPSLFSEYRETHHTTHVAIRELRATEDLVPYGVGGRLAFFTDDEGAAALARGFATMNALDERGESYFVVFATPLSLLDERTAR